MIPGIFARTFAERPFEAARRAGYAAVQYNMACAGLDPMPEVIPAELAASIRADAKASGIQIAALSATYNMIHPDAGVREKGLRRLRVLAEAARAMGTRLLTLCTGTLDAEDQWRRHPGNDGPEPWRSLLESMEAAVKIADEFDVDLGIEPEHANVVSSARRARRLIDELGSPRVRIVLDGANLFEVETLERQRAIVAEGIELLADRISLAHAKDRLADGRFTRAGAGVLDYGHYLARLHAAGFRGPLVTHGLAEEDAVPVERFLSQFPALAPGAA
ncbi:sugar phosphate isomerase/epimerase family protein [Paludibaculum fermentans]|uniref:Sugar phosphate isomerase/epimerase n=1 Tax=Paludibaculum fermentans TaxID=1473598 RepID=A0A7S7NLW6_PALFE|nr:sugar phosphate isomerase/epimerase family protein [Paludibaculum fermentans]QOY85529.1 sugar phosphate isomerase/epimerase [Paludibaculum fermentans]